MIKYDTQTLPNIFLFVEMLSKTVEFKITRTDRGNFEFKGTPLLTAPAAGSPRYLSLENIENAYALSDLDAKIQWYNHIRSIKEHEIERLREEIKNKEVIIRNSQKKIGYKEILKEHPDLFV